MADLSDVINGLKAVIVATLYPNGSSNPVSPVNSVATTIYGGWPLSKTLDAALGAGKVTVSIFTGQAERNTVRFLPKWQVIGTIAAGATSATVSNEVGRTQRDFQISVWSNNPTSRDATAAAVDLALRSLRNLPLPDGSVASINYSRSIQDDGQQKENVYIRHLFFSIEYGTFQTMQAPLVTSVIANVKGGLDVTDLKTTTITVPETSP
jgi:hypothetical protein